MATNRPKLRIHGMDGFRGLAAVNNLALHTFGYTALVTVGANRSEYGEVIGQSVYDAIMHNTGASEAFFVLSGLLLSLPFVRWLLVPGERKPNLRTFTRNRIRRIFPLYLLVLFITASTIAVANAGPRNVLLNALLVENMFLDTDGIGLTPRIVSVSWTLNVELGFYILLPIMGVLMALAIRRLPKLWQRAAMASLLPLVSYAVGWFTRAHPRLHFTTDLIPNFIFRPSNTFFAYADAFGTGWLIAIVIVAALHSRGRISRRIRALPSLAWTIPGTTLIVVAMMARWDGMHDAVSPSQWHHPWWPIVEAVGMGMLLLAVGLRPDTSWLGRFCASAIMMSIGARTYGIFLWHFEILHVLLRYDLLQSGGYFAVVQNIVVVFVLSYTMAWFSWHLVEAPFLQGRITLPKLDLNPRRLYNRFTRVPRMPRPVLLVGDETIDEREW